MRSDGSFSFQEQLKREIQEELGVRAETMAELKAFGVVHDTLDHVYDIGVFVNISQSSQDICSVFANTKNREYDQLKVVPLSELEEFLKSSKVVPVSTELIRNCPFSPFDLFLNKIAYREIARTMYEIRAFELKLLELFAKGQLSGTTHTCIGQEAISLALMHHCKKEDYVFGSHRAHGHYIARGASLYCLFAEIMGKSSGVCGGLGGSQHLCDGNFFTNGIQGGISASAAGIALGIKLDKKSNSKPISIVFIGDGTLGEGLVYETMNMASLWNLPILFVLEDNLYAQSTPKEQSTAGSQCGRAEAFGIPSSEIKSNDVGELISISKIAVDYVRNERRPYFLRIETYRLEAHSKGDDDRDPEEIFEARKLDPLHYLERYIKKDALPGIQKLAQIEVDKAASKALLDEAPSLAMLRVDTPERMNPEENQLLLKSWLMPQTKIALAAPYFTSV